MLDKLKQKWKVNTFQLILILCTFALGGSLCGYTGRKILKLIHFENDVFYIFVYILTLTVLWPFCVLLISIPFGQFNFFVSYLRKIRIRLFGH